MVAKGKVYGKKKKKDLVSLFVDLSISPTKPGEECLLIYLMLGVS